jgi:D-glycero-D-manno-heptose 1,7-bisphosphate phosphatase
MKPQAKAIFLDKDGTLVNDVPYNVDPARVTLTPKAGEGLRLFNRLGYRLFVVSNQPGVALGHFREAELERVWRRIDQLLQAEGVRIAGYYHCPHYPVGRVLEYSRACGCRKPAPGLILRAALDHGLDLGASWMVGDILHDVEAGRRAGCRTILIDNGNETEWDLSPLRNPHLTAANLHAAALKVAATHAPAAREVRFTMQQGEAR